MFVLTLPLSSAQEELFDISYYMNESFNQSYIYMDIYLAENGKCFVYGETSENITLPGVLIEDGVIVGKTGLFTSRSGDVWTFNVAIPQVIDETLINLYLPENTTVREINTNLDARFSADEGLLISFSGESLAPGILFDYTLGEMATGQAAGAPASVPVVWLAIGLAAAAIVYKLTNKGKIKPSKLDAIRPTLSDRERMIIDKLVELGGEAKQKVLEKDQGIPKASLSRTLFHMERKGLIKRHKLGISKRIVLSDEYK
jgi:uncharacterized membrane protein